MSINLLKQKIGLGTVQLGLPYGINNKAGKPDRKVAFDILDYARQQQIHLLDTAEAYGDAIHVIGSYVKSRESSSFAIVNKFVSGDEPLAEKLAAGLMSLSTPHLYGYLFHRYDDYVVGTLRGDLLALKERKQIQHIGVSIYGLHELEIVLEDPDIDIIQIPFNPFDATKEKKSLLREAKNQGKEIHVRSVFLQGLFFKKPEDLTGNLLSFSQPLKTFQQKVKENGLNIQQACLNHALHQAFIDYVIIGVETVEQLEQNVASILPVFPAELEDWSEQVSLPDATLLNPSNWKL